MFEAGEVWGVDLLKHPFSNVKVVDLANYIAGALCPGLLADFGAEVIKVEALTGDPFRGLGSTFQDWNRGKRSICIDLKTEAGRGVLYRLVEDADVVVENYRPGVSKRLGADYETLSKVNPNMVYCSVSAYGQEGPYRLRPGFDQIAQGMGGLMWITGVPGQGPMRVGVPIADLASGLYAAIGILTALLQREETDEGQWVHTSLLEAQIAMLDFQAARWLIANEVPQQAGNNHPTSIPTGVFQTRDGYINVACSGEQMWRRLCDVLNAEDLYSDSRYSDSEARLANRDALNASLQEHFATQCSARWIDALNAAGVPCGPIYHMDEMWSDPQVAHLKMWRDVDHSAIGAYRVVRHAINMSSAPDLPYKASPDRGEHTDEILTEFGFSEDEIATMKKGNIV